MIPEATAKRAFTRWNDVDGCHISTYSIGSHGYAQIGWCTAKHGRGMTTAHRAAWVHVNGQIPEGMTVDHLCKNRQCVNVSHLRVLSNFENGRRTFGRDWPLGQCRNGHPNSELVTTYRGRRECRHCRNIWQRAYRARKKADS